MRPIARICPIVLVIAVWFADSGAAMARGGLGGFHGQGYHIGGVGVPYGGVSMGAAAASAISNASAAAHFAPSIGSPVQPFSLQLGGVGGFHYNQSYANPYAYHNPYIYHPYSSPFQVPFTHAF